MQQAEITEMCERLASKYNNRQDFDDLVSVGTLKCLELMERGVTKPSTLYYRARDEMNEYINMRSSPISYSKGSYARENHFKKAEHEFVDLMDTELQAVDTFGSFEIKNILQVLSGKLSDHEKSIMLTLYNNNNNLTEAANELGVSKQAVEQTRNHIRHKFETICELD